MTLKEFRNSLTSESPPEGIDELLKALWYDAKGDWARAHSLAQEVGGRNGAWVHAYLHRREGDLSNAGYWYSRAGHRQPLGGLDVEWEELVRAML